MYVLKERNIKLKEILGTHLSLRDSANQLFDEVVNIQNQTVILDFSGVQTMSRSFAQQFLSRMDVADRQIVCMNEPKSIELMFDVVIAKRDKPVVANAGKGKAVNLSSIFN